jgi:hypothetical protein
MFLRLGTALNYRRAGLVHRLDFLLLMLVEALQFLRLSAYGRRSCSGRSRSGGNRIGHPHHSICRLFGFTFVRIVWFADFQLGLNERLGRTEKRRAILATREKIPA